jgi:ATP-dependent RNA helicase DeaD
LSGELSQAERTQALASVRSGRARVCVATDVAARGLDLPDLGLVIHADLPIDRETLLHRSGRTGRAGRKGLCAILVPHPARRRAERLFMAAGIAVEWVAAPGPDEIRDRDRERLLADPVLTARPLEGELVQARSLLADHTAEAVATALVRLYRANLPPPETLHAAPRLVVNETHVSGSTSWFRIGIGRRRNADPKWLLPMICRLGEVTRQDIGAIRVLDNETRFEVAGTAVTRFTDALKQAGENEPRIEPAEAVAPARGHAPKTFRRKR